MKKKNKLIKDAIEKELLARAVIAISLLIIMILSIFTLVTIKIKSKKVEPTPIETIPEIKEEFTKSELTKYKDYNNYVYLDSDSKEIRLNSDNEDNILYYVIGKFGKIYNTPIEVDNEKKSDSVAQIIGNYKIIYDESEFKYYYLNVEEKTSSEYYDDIIPIYFKNGTCKYIILKQELDDTTELYLLNILTDEVIKLDENISSIPDIEKSSESNQTYINSKYLIVMNSDNKYGLIDYSGNVILDYKYDYLETYKKDDRFIAKKDNKYGIIKYNEEILMDFNYDEIYYTDEINNYTLAIKNNKLGIYYNDKVIIDFTIDFKRGTKNNDVYYCLEKNDTLYLSVSPDGDPNSDKVKNNTMNYLITKKGIQKTTDGIMSIAFESNDEESTKYKYFYKVVEDNDNLKISFYDVDYYEYYTFTIPYEKKYDYNIFVQRIDKTNYYQVNLVYYDLETTEKDKIYYVDLFNSKQVKDIDVIYKYFDNGYGFTLNSNGLLNIYKNKELLASYNNITTYLGDYYFLKTNYSTSNTEFKSTIYKLEFKKESNN